MRSDPFDRALERIDQTFDTLVKKTSDGQPYDGLRPVRQAMYETVQIMRELVVSLKESHS